MSDKIKIEYSRAPSQVDPIAIPVGYADLHGDGTEFGLKVATSGISATALGTPRTRAVTVTSAAPVPLAAANLTRKSILIKNNDAANPVFIRGDEAATADFNSIALGPKESYSSDVTGAAYTAITTTGLSVIVTVEEIATV